MITGLAWVRKARGCQADISIIRGMGGAALACTGWILYERRGEKELPMKIGMEPDPVEEFDREQERAIAAAVRAQFGHGDLREALRQVDRLAERRLKMNGQLFFA